MKRLPYEGSKDGLLGMQAVFSLIIDDRRRTIGDFSSNLFTSDERHTIHIVCSGVGALEMLARDTPFWLNSLFKLFFLFLLHLEALPVLHINNVSALSCFHKVIGKLQQAARLLHGGVSKVNIFLVQIETFWIYETQVHPQQGPCCHHGVQHTQRLLPLGIAPRHNNFFALELAAELFL